MSGSQSVQHLFLLKVN